uniref:Uncharacterized protein n=1 Tax=Dromaius novaehollandiae TaxID=8790 RepID=A0A8C4JPS9_DRONO
MGLYLNRDKYSSLGHLPLGNRFVSHVYLIVFERWDMSEKQWVSIAFLTISIDQKINWKKFRYIFYQYSFFHFCTSLVSLSLIQVLCSSFILYPFQFEKLGYRKPWIHIPVLLVHIAATVMEYLHLALKPFFSFTPFLTRNEVWHVTVTHTFRIDKARSQLGYKPKKFSLADSVDHYLKTRPIGQDDHTFFKMLFAFSILLSLVFLSFFS